MAAIDRALLEATGRARPRVAILPTASWPDGEPTFHRWAAMGEEHFAALGAEVEAVCIRDRRDADDPACAQAIGEADLIYLSGGKPDHLSGASQGSASEPPSGPPTPGAPSWSVARRGRWSSPAAAWEGAPTPPPAAVPSRAGATPLRSSRGRAVLPHYDALPGAARRPPRPAGAARDHRPGDRRGHGRRGPGRRVAGPRPWPRDRLAGTAPRAAPRRRDVPDLTPPGVRPSRRGSARLDRPEAVGAVDRLVHAGLERDLGVVPAARAGHREVLADGRLAAPLVAARPADAPDVASRRRAPGAGWRGSSGSASAPR